jgi:hypothetical protein
VQQASSRILAVLYIGSLPLELRGKLMFFAHGRLHGKLGFPRRKPAGQSTLTSRDFRLLHQEGSVPAADRGARTSRAAAVARTAAEDYWLGGKFLPLSLRLSVRERCWGW